MYMVKVHVYVTCFLLAIPTVHCFTGIFKGFRRFASDRRVQKDHEAQEAITGETGGLQEVKIPERLFSTEVAPKRKSYCYQARLEFDKLCGLRSPSERARMASLVTNCHLEASGRPVFVWDPIKKLEDADENYVYLVMQFVPLMTDVCEKVGQSALLTQLVADANSGDDIREKINELRDATERLFEANRQSSEFVLEYMNMSTDASKRALQMLNISVAIKETNDAIDAQWEAMQQEVNDLKAELRMLLKNSVSQFDSLSGKFDGFQTQIGNMEMVVGRLQSDTQATSLFLKAPLEAISNHSKNIEFQMAKSQEFYSSLPFSPLRKVGLLKDIVLGPIKLSERIRHFESNKFVGPFAKDIVSSVQLLLILLSMYIGYTVLVTFTSVVEAILRFVAIFGPFKPIVSKLSHLINKGSRPKPLLQQPLREELYEYVSVSISKALSTSRLAEKLAKVIRNDGTDMKFSLLFARMSEIDRHLSQISHDVSILHGSLRSLDRVHVIEADKTIVSKYARAISDGTVQKSEDTLPITSAVGEGFPVIGNRTYVRTSGEMTNALVSKEKMCTKDYNYSKLQVSDSQGIRATRDGKPKALGKEDKRIMPKRECVRRRSVRKKGT